MNRYKENIDSKNPHITEGKTEIQPNKITISFPSSQVHAYDEEDTTNPVTIYLYAPSKKSVKVQVSPKIPMSDIKKIAQEKIGVRADHQLLYLSGKNVTQYGYVRLMNNNIIHILDSDDLCGRNEQIQLKVTVFNCLQGAKEENTKIIKQYKVIAKDSIEEFSQQLQRDVRREWKDWKASAKLYLLQSSRLLEKDKSFIDQDITRRTQIICVITENQIKTRFSNDTKEEILHDISELLGFEEKTEEKPEPPPTEQRTIRPRFRPKEPKKVYPVQEPKEEEEDPYGLLAAKSLHASVTLPNFKKKPNAVQKTMSFQDGPKQLATKLKSSKSKKDLEKMLNSQQKQKLIFESPETIKQVPKGQREDAEQQLSQEAKESEKKKPSPQIPKAMPMKERRQIRMQIQKLFDLGEEPKSIKSETIDIKEEISPISPPTSTASPAPKPKDLMRLSLGARPLFLDQLRAPHGKQQG